MAKRQKATQTNRKILIQQYKNTTEHTTIHTTEMPNCGIFHFTSFITFKMLTSKFNSNAFFLTLNNIEIFIVSFFCLKICALGHALLYASKQTWIFYIVLLLEKRF